MTLAIRDLAPGDRPAWEPLWAGYLAFYETSLPPETTDRTWGRFLDPSEPTHALGAFAAGVDGGPEALVGIVHYLFHRTTWSPRDNCYLQDLFTAEAARGQGAGRALIEAVYARAVAKGSGRVYWQTQEGNATARALYDQVASHLGFIVYRKDF